MEFSTPEIIDGNSYYRIPEEAKKLLNITNDKLIYHPLKMNELNNIIQLAIDKYHKDLEFICSDGEDRTYLLGNNLGRQLETLISKYLNNNTSDLLYRQGNEGNECDFTCLTNNIYSIELKTSKQFRVKIPIPVITGNKAYAEDKEDKKSKKSKNHFYLLINYDFKDYKVARYHAWFGFIKQSDWKAAKKGGTCKLITENEDLQKRLIQIN
jgi:hypothetical protein